MRLLWHHDCQLSFTEGVRASERVLRLSLACVNPDERSKLQRLLLLRWISSMKSACSDASLKKMSCRLSRMKPFLWLVTRVVYSVSFARGSLCSRACRCCCTSAAAFRLDSSAVLLCCSSCYSCQRIPYRQSGIASVRVCLLPEANWIPSERGPWPARALNRRRGSSADSCAWRFSKCLCRRKM